MPGDADGISRRPGYARSPGRWHHRRGRDVGTAAAFSRQIDLQELNFIYQGDRILDEQTGSQWDVFGRAVAGELAGARLDPVVSVNHFWFSWAAFKPETRINQP